MIRIEVKDRDVLEALRQLASRCSRPAGAMREIGELVAERVKERFGTGIGPDGARWAPNTETTYLQHLAEWKGSYTKKGKLSAKGSDRAATKKPLIGRTRSLSTTIYYRAYPGSVEIGSPLVTVRIRPFTVEGKTVHLVGMPFCFGWTTAKCGDSTNRLTAFVGDPNTGIPEYKASLVNLRKAEELKEIA